MGLLPSETVGQVFTSRPKWSELTGYTKDRKTGKNRWTVKLAKLADAGEAVQAEIVGALTARLP